MAPGTCKLSVLIGTVGFIARLIFDAKLIGRNH